MPAAKKTNHELIPCPPSVQEAMVGAFARETMLLYDTNLLRGRGSNKKHSVSVSLNKELSKAIAETSRGITTGTKFHPFDYNAVGNFMLSNTHHSTCINTKVQSTVGLGFVTEEGKVRQKAGDTRIVAFEESKVDKLLDPLCDKSFQNVITTVADDFFQRGNGLMEVKREEPFQDSPIIALHPIPVPTARIVVEDGRGTKHWQIFSEGIESRFCEYGDLDRFLQTDLVKDTTRVSEVIHFADPSSLSRWYGMPKWLAAVPCIELVQMMHQERFDFYMNRGVPEFFMFITGALLDKADWKKVEDALAANIGLGNMHKTLALNLANKDIKIQIDKLAADRQAGEFGEMSDAMALSIVSAHMTPPLLGGIVIPGKLGATNELPNALMAFQLLVCGPAQRLIGQMLRTTLGNSMNNGGLSLTPPDFTFNLITDQMNLNAMATVGGMRQTLPEAQAAGRDLTAGMKKENDPQG